MSHVIKTSTQSIWKYCSQSVFKFPFDCIKDILKGNQKQNSNNMRHYLLCNEFDSLNCKINYRIFSTEYKKQNTLNTEYTDWQQFNIQLYVHFNRIIQLPEVKTQNKKKILCVMMFALKNSGKLF